MNRFLNLFQYQRLTLPSLTLTAQMGIIFLDFRSSLSQMEYYSHRHGTRTSHNFVLSFKGIFFFANFAWIFNSMDFAMRSAADARWAVLLRLVGKGDTMSFEFVGMLLAAMPPP